MVFVHAAEAGGSGRKRAEACAKLGAKLYEEKNVYEAATAAQALAEKYPQDLTPEDVWNP